MTCLSPLHCAFVLYRGHDCIKHLSCRNLITSTTSSTWRDACMLAGGAIFHPAACTCGGPRGWRVLHGGAGRGGGTRGGAPAGRGLPAGRVSSSAGASAAVCGGPGCPGLRQSGRPVRQQVTARWITPFCASCMLHEQSTGLVNAARLLRLGHAAQPADVALRPLHSTATSPSFLCICTAIAACRLPSRFMTVNGLYQERVH